MPPGYAMKQTIDDIHLFTLRKKKKDSKKKTTEQVLRKSRDT